MIGRQRIELTILVRKLFRALAVALFALALSCEGGSNDDSKSTAVNPLPANAPVAQDTSVGDVLVGLERMPVPAGVDPQLFQELKDALADALWVNRGWRLVAKVPPGLAGMVTDLSVEGAQSKTLTWHYRNIGDYNQDGIVSIMDITPLAVHFNEAVGSDPVVEVADGNEDGFVTIADITPLAVGFFNQVSYYSVEGSDLPDSGYSEVGTVSLASATGTGRLLFGFDLGLPEHSYYRVIAHDDEGGAGEPSNAVYIEPLEPPEILDVWPRSGLSGYEVEFSSVVSGSEPLTYLWDFGGGASPNGSALKLPTVTLGDPGEYAARLTVSNAVGENRFDFVLTVIDPADLPDVQSVSPTEGISGDTVQITAVVTGAPPFSYTWDFDGGAEPNASTEESPQVTLGAEGEYNCSLKVVNQYGEHTLFFTLIVNPPT